MKCLCERFEGKASTGMEQSIQAYAVLLAFWDLLPNTLICKQWGALPAHKKRKKNTLGTLSPHRAHGVGRARKGRQTVPHASS